MSNIRKTPNIFANDGTVHTVDSVFPNTRWQKMEAIPSDILLVAVNRILREVNSRTNPAPGMESAVNAAWKANVAALRILRGEVYPNDEVVAMLAGVRRLALEAKRDVING